MRSLGRDGVTALGKAQGPAGATEVNSMLNRFVEHWRNCT